MLPDHLIQDLRYIEIYTGRRFPSLRAGAYQSRLNGVGFDFDEHRPYRPGDDVRKIDWNVTARMNTPYIRQTHAERELNIIIAVDVSRSMEFGTTKYSKKEIQLLLAGCLVFSSLSDQVNTGFLTFDKEILFYSPPNRNRAQAWRFLEELWTHESRQTETNLLPMVRHLDNHYRQEGMLFVISDFLTYKDELDSRELQILAVKHDIIAVVIEDPAEHSLPTGNSRLYLKDVETGKKKWLELSQVQRKKYSDAMKKRHDEMVAAFYRVPMDYIFIDPKNNSVESLLKLFTMRRRK